MPWETHITRKTVTAQMKNQILNGKTISAIYLLTKFNQEIDTSGSHEDAAVWIS